MTPGRCFKPLSLVCSCIERSLITNHKESPFFGNFYTHQSLVSTNLSLGQRRDPAYCQVQSNVHDTNDPESHRKVCTAVHETEDDCEHHTTKVASSTSQTGHDAVG